MEPFDRRLPLYSYLRPLIEGRRVLEVGAGSGRGAEHLVSLGATAVVSIEDGASRARPRVAGVTFAPHARAAEAQGPYDLVIVGDGRAFVRGSGGIDVAAAARMLAPNGFVVVAVENADRAGARGGVGYYELQDALAAQLPEVRMFGQTPFAAFGIAEFDGGGGGLQIDSGLVDSASEEPTHYVAVAGAARGPAFGYGLVQVPVPVLAPEPPPQRMPRAPAAMAKPADAVAATRAPEPDAADLRRRLAEAEARAEGATRTARAQTDEIEELRGRLKRAAEARAQLDDEVARLRRALAEADESVLTLTRRTTEEFSALASRLTAGLRAQAPEAARSPELSAVLERLREREATLARRESEIAERDERIAALETEKQDLLWRSQAAEAAAGETASRVELDRVSQALEERESRVRVLEQALASARNDAEQARSAARRLEEESLRRARELASAGPTDDARERALMELRRAAAEHVRESERLRVEIRERETLVAELEETLEASEARRTGLEGENERLRRSLAEAEESDRSRRSRLSELEGKLLRAQRERAAAYTDSDEGRAAAAIIGELRGRLAALEASMREASEGRDEAERRWADAIEQMVGLEQANEARARELELDRDALRSKLENFETDSSGAALKVAEQDLRRLRSALERSEEALQQARAQLFPMRARVASLEQAQASRDAAERSFVRRVVDEVALLEAGLAAERDELLGIERALLALAGPPEDAGVGEGNPFFPSNREG